MTRVCPTGSTLRVLPKGYITFRWMLADHYPVPQCTQVKRGELLARLPATVKRITPAQRLEQLAARRRGIARRFGPL